MIREHLGSRKALKLIGRLLILDGTVTSVDPARQPPTKKGTSWRPLLVPINDFNQTTSTQ